MPDCGTVRAAPAAPQMRPALAARIVQRRIQSRTRSTRRPSRQKLLTKASDTQSCTRPKAPQMMRAGREAPKVQKAAAIPAMPIVCAASATG